MFTHMLEGGGGKVYFTNLQSFKHTFLDSICSYEEVPVIAIKQCQTSFFCSFFKDFDY